MNTKGPVTDSTGQIVKPKTTTDPGLRMQELIERMKPEMARALPRHVTPDRMARIVMTAVRTTPRLAECTPVSFLGCLMSLAQLGLEPNTNLGYAYLIPRNNKKRNAVECTLLIGYQGMLELSRRSGLVDRVYAHVVRAGDTFEYTLGTDDAIRHVPAGDDERETRPITHVYAVAVIKSSGASRPFVVLTRSQVEARRRRSMAANDGPWITDYEAMCLKTAVRALWTWLPRSAEVARAEALEVASETGRSVLTATDESVTALLESHGFKEAADADVVESETLDLTPDPDPVVRTLAS